MAQAVCTEAGMLAFEMADGQRKEEGNREEHVVAKVKEVNYVIMVHFEQCRHEIDLL